MHDEMQEPTEEEMRAALEEQMRNLRVDDVILQTVATLVNLGGRRLGLATPPGEDPAADRDLDQARLAIDAVRALAPHVAPEQVEPLRQAMSQLQIAYAREAGGEVPPAAAPGSAAGPGAAPPGAASPGATPPGGPPSKADEEAERAKARSRIWTPGSSS
jgi:hypothetical protein